jgi:hypothetical protein
MAKNDHFTIANIVADFHLDKRYQEFYEKNKDAYSGFAGIRNELVAVALAADSVWEDLYRENENDVDGRFPEWVEFVVYKIFELGSFPNSQKISEYGQEFIDDIQEKEAAATWTLPADTVDILNWIGYASEVAEIRRDQYEAAGEGRVEDAVQELHEVDEDEANDIGDRLQELIGNLDKFKKGVEDGSITISAHPAARTVKVKTAYRVLLSGSEYVCEATPDEDGVRKFVEGNHPAKLLRDAYNQWLEVDDGSDVSFEDFKGFAQIVKVTEAISDLKAFDL